MKNEEFTEWFPAKKKPSIEGVYERKIKPYKTYAYWNGEFWGSFACRIIDAPMYKNSRSEYQGKGVWRGLKNKS